MTKSNTKIESTNDPILDSIQFPNGIHTKSAQIRFLFSVGHKPTEIRDIMSYLYDKKFLYQHVRNVLNTPLKKT